ncbi:MAG: histidine phosphatase family protein [Candidatus Phaeomarinobacter sp.]
MKRLLLLRHAKSDWSDEDLDDHARTLNARGRGAATRMGRYIRENGLTPQLIVCSTATRTRETLDLLQEEMGGEAKVCFDRGLYLAMPEQMLDVALSHLEEAEQEPECILILAHNPGTHSLALGLSHSGDAQVLGTLQRKYPTAALAVIECDAADWADLPAGGHLKAFVMPRTLPDVS